MSDKETLTDEQQNAESVVQSDAETANAESEQQAATENAECASAEDAAAEEKHEPTLEEKYAELEKENAELKNSYLRKVADFDNYRKRMIKEKQDAFDYANTAILTDLIAILDDFDRGIAAAADAKDIKTLVDGVKMINKQMHGFLDSKYNLTSYCEKGDAFDPNIHEAIASVPADVAEPVCAEVYLKGYKLKERVIRHAKVMVHMPNPENKAEETSAEEKTE